MSLVAIVGRPNVGKSTLFNRLIGEKKAIVDDVPGVTRDRLYGTAEWNGKKFTLIDTGGFVPKTEDEIEIAVREQAIIAIEEADAILFVCDGRDGITNYDIDIANILRRREKNVLLLVNKCDNSEQDQNSFEFHRLGLGKPYPISALSGRNSWEFLDDLVELLPEKTIKDEDPRLKIAIVGRPNVGKSSIVNALVGKPRSIVTDIPGTTRDSIDTIIKHYNEEIVLIDTAGLRRRSSIKESIEFYSVVRTVKAIERSDVAVVVIDATRGLEDQDKKIINSVEEARKGIIIAVNKWDLIEKDAKTAEAFTEAAQAQLKALSYLPIITVSAVTKQRVFKAIDLAEEIWQARRHRIETSVLNRALLPEIQRSPPWSKSGKEIKVKYITQLATEPPLFALYASNAKLVQGSYKKYVERLIREKFGFKGVPIEVQFRQK